MVGQEISEQEMINRKIMPRAHTSEFSVSGNIALCSMRQLIHEKLIHEQLIHEQLINEQLMHEQLIHEQLIHEQLIHEQLIHEQLIHGATDPRSN